MKIKQVPIDKQDMMASIFESILAILWRPWLTRIVTYERPYSQTDSYR